MEGRSWVSAARPDVAEGRAGRLLHDVAQLTGEDQVMVARRQQAGFDEQDVATHLGPRDASHHAWLRDPERHLLLETRWPQVAGDVVCVNDGRRQGFRSRRDACRHLARHGAHLALEVAHTRFARVVAGDPPNRVVVQDQLVWRQAVFGELAGHEVARGDVQFLLFAVAR